MRRLATVGLVLVALMQGYFFVTGSDRPFPYREVQLVSVVATLAMAFSASRGPMLAFAVGAGVNFVTRVLQPILGLTRLALWANVLLALGWGVACAQAARGRSPALGLWILAIGHALSMLTAFGRMGSAVALGVGAIGLFLAAPHVRGEPGPA